MKKVFMPSMDELYQMQDKGANIYKYILVKAIESLICNGINYPSKGILEGAQKYLRENPEIARAICTLYPNEIIYSEAAKNDINLAVRLMDYKKHVENGLNYLCRFDSSVLTNTHVLTNAILKLEQELINNPSYRFEYIRNSALTLQNRESEGLLDKIFNREISDNDLMMVLYSKREEVIKALANIEPSYCIKLSEDYFSNKFYSKNEYIRTEYLHSGIANYAERYGISPTVGTEYFGKDILSNPDTEVKRLIKCINDRR